MRERSGKTAGSLVYRKNVLVMLARNSTDTFNSHVCSRSATQSLHSMRLIGVPQSIDCGDASSISDQSGRAKLQRLRIPWTRDSSTRVRERHTHGMEMYQKSVGGGHGYRPV